MRFPIKLLTVSYPRLKPIHELDDVGMFHALQHLKLIIHHLLIALHVLLKDDLHCDLASRAVCLPDNAIGPSTEGSTKAVFCSRIWSEQFQ
jgi:hypothetical protein